MITKIAKDTKVLDSYTLKLRALRVLRGEVFPLTQVLSLFEKLSPLFFRRFQ
jgi:hypothetical protein